MQVQLDTKSGEYSVYSPPGDCEILGAVIGAVAAIGTAVIGRNATKSAKRASAASQPAATGTDELTLRNAAEINRLKAGITSPRTDTSQFQIASSQNVLFLAGGALLLVVVLSKGKR